MPSLAELIGISLAIYQQQLPPNHIFYVGAQKLYASAQQNEMLLKKPPILPAEIPIFPLTNLLAQASLWLADRGDPDQQRYALKLMSEFIVNFEPLKIESAKQPSHFPLSDLEQQLLSLLQGGVTSKTTLQNTLYTNDPNANLNFRKLLSRLRHDVPGLNIQSHRGRDKLTINYK